VAPPPSRRRIIKTMLHLFREKKKRVKIVVEDCIGFSVFRMNFNMRCKILLIS
jgi:hypothetical protein